MLNSRGAEARKKKCHYYSKPLNEFKNSYFSAFAIQSPCLGLMQKMPFAFLLGARQRAPAHTGITLAINLCHISAALLLLLLLLSPMIT